MLPPELVADPTCDHRGRPFVELHDAALDAYILKRDVVAAPVPPVVAGTGNLELSDAFDLAK